MYYTHKKFISVTIPDRNTSNKRKGPLSLRTMMNESPVNGLLQHLLTISFLIPLTLNSSQNSTKAFLVELTRILYLPTKYGKRHLRGQPSSYDNKSADTEVHLSPS